MFMDEKNDSASYRRKFMAIDTICLNAATSHPICIEIKEKPDGLLGDDKLVHEAPLRLGSDKDTSNQGSETAQSDSPAPTGTPDIDARVSNTGHHQAQMSDSAQSPPKLATATTNAIGSSVATLGDRIGKFIDGYEIGKIVVRASAGTRAYRHYDWLSRMVGTSLQGNLRVFVKNEDARVAFLLAGGCDSGQIAPGIGRTLRNLRSFDQVLKFAGWGAEILAEWPKICEIVSSRDTKERKGARLAGAAWTVTQRCLTGKVASGTQLMYKALEGWCMIGGLIWTGSPIKASGYGQVFRNADRLVQTNYKIATDAGDQWWLVTTLVSSARRAALYKNSREYLTAAWDGLTH